MADIERFKKAWLTGKNIKEVAEALHMTQGSVRTLASKYRKEGHDLPRKFWSPFSDPEFARTAALMSQENRRKK